MTVFITHGEAPLSDSQFHRRTQKKIALDWPLWKRERALRKAEASYVLYMEGWEADTDTNRSANQFNADLVAYRNATARLAKIELSVGRAAYSEEIDTGAVMYGEETGEASPVMLTIDHPAIDPVDVTIQSFDEAGGPITIPNPVITKDEAERDAAQDVVDVTSGEVVSFGP